MGHDRGAGPRSHIWLAVVLGAAFVAVAAGLFVTVLLAGRPSSDAGGQASDEGRSSGEVPVRAFADYSWTELGQIADKVRDAPTDDAAREVASAYGVAIGAARTVRLQDGNTATATVVGIRADTGTGLTFMLGPLGLRAMNDSATNAGGWEGSSLRAWLAQEGMGLLPEDLASTIVPVAKLTNNVGVTADASSVTQTTDALWLFSASEVCGAPDWFTSEYGSTPVAGTGYTDFAAYDALLGAEGAQYEYFAQAGVGPATGAGGALAVRYAGQDVAWWYRTPYPYSFAGDDASYFFQVMAGGYPDSVGRADEAAGVVAGFCL